MNEMELIFKLAASSAGQPPAQTVDLTDRVMASIRRTSASPTRIWLVTAAASCAIAILASVIAAQSWSSLTNPLADLSFAQTAPVMP